jgi:hypothetical protein
MPFPPGGQDPPTFEGINLSDFGAGRPWGLAEGFPLFSVYINDFLFIFYRQTGTHLFDQIKFQKKS